MRGLYNIALDKQVHIYSLDTTAFFTEEELSLHKQIIEINKEKEIYLNGRKYKELVGADKNGYLQICRRKTEVKNKLYELFKANTSIRVLNPKYISKYNVISVFESTLTRTLNIDTNQLSDEIIVVRAYYYDVLHDMICNGFAYNGEKYKYFTSSAGQIRTKKAVFIKESLWEKHCKTLMCGLTYERINECGGVNVNKFMAYLALLNSATDVFEGFDINKCIVVDDLETTINSTVDFIDDITYEITRKNMDIPIVHTDGCGLCLPSVSKKNFMIRLPWIKGLLAVCDFRKFIKKKNGNKIIKDIYGKAHDIIEEDIQIIFTKSQFKMYKYYKSWDEYKKCFTKYRCQAGYCNVEDNYIKNASINYQMLQTLNTMTNEELLKISEYSINKISNLCTSLDSMLSVFGINDECEQKTPLQESLKLYPELFTDSYIKDVLKKIKASIIKKYRSGKLDIKGKYTFIIPDIYAICEYLFLDKKNPDGLISNGEVSCRLYPTVDKLDCLRAPHLMTEHVIRKNKITKEISEWFCTDALYVGCHDIMSKIMMFDCDGDKSLVVADETLIRVAERHIKMYDIVPLCYDMKKSNPVIFNDEELYNGLYAAYTGGNIGEISNTITKIWNKDDFCIDDLSIIKILCMENNYVIDYAKTLYKPKRPEHIDSIIKEYQNLKLPHFFKYAKDKKSTAVNKLNRKDDYNTVVNRLFYLFKDFRLKFNLSNFGRIDYKLLMSNPEIKIDSNVIDKYYEFNKVYCYKLSISDSKYDVHKYLIKVLKDTLSEFKYSDVEICDMLVKELFHENKNKAKESLWYCYGDIILDNLKTNIVGLDKICKKCGSRFKSNSKETPYCDVCIKRKKIKVKIILCVDCFKEVEVDARNMTKTRCNECQHVKDKELSRIRVQKFRNK